MFLTILCSLACAKDSNMSLEEIHRIYPSARPCEVRLFQAGPDARMVPPFTEWGTPDLSHAVICDKECVDHIDRLRSLASNIGDDLGGSDRMLRSHHSQEFYEIIDEALAIKGKIHVSSLIRLLFAITHVFDDHDHWLIDTETPERAASILQRMAARWQNCLVHSPDELRLDPADLENMRYKAEQFAENCEKAGYEHFSLDPASYRYEDYNEEFFTDGRYYADGTAEFDFVLSLEDPNEESYCQIQRFLRLKPELITEDDLETTLEIMQYDLGTDDPEKLMEYAETLGLQTLFQDREFHRENGETFLTKEHAERREL